MAAGEAEGVQPARNQIDVAQHAGGVECDHDAFASGWDTCLGVPGDAAGALGRQRGQGSKIATQPLGSSTVW